MINSFDAIYSGTSEHKLLIMHLISQDERQNFLFFFAFRRTNKQTKHLLFTLQREPTYRILFIFDLIIGKSLSIELIGENSLMRHLEIEMV
jgi:hypothetical protein